MIIKPDRNIKLPKPWYWTEQDLSTQLKSADHPLAGVKTKTIARRDDRDDVLFELDEGRYAYIHITWQKYVHSDKRWPITKIYQNWQEVYNDRILPDAEEFK